MEITIEFIQWRINRINDTRRRQFTWNITFNAETPTENVFELALGYIYALTLLRPRDASINITLDGIKYPKFLQLPNVYNYFLSRSGDLPNIDESMADYLQRIHARNITMQYIIVISPDGDGSEYIHVLQFNSMSFLQGFLSVFNAFHIGTVTYIINIYDAMGNEYTYR